MQPGLCLLQCEPQENKRGYVVIVRILQRNRTDRTYIRTEGDLLQGIGSRGYGRGQVPRSTVLKLEPQESPWCSSSPKTCWLQPQEEPVFQGESTSRNKTKFQLRAVRQEEIPHGEISLSFYLGLRLIGRGSPTLGRPTCFTRSTDSNINLIQKRPHRHTHHNI